MKGRLRKLPYYLESYVSLHRLIADGRVLGRTSRPIELRNGLSFRVSGLLDLLILKETLVDDAYGLGDLEGPVRCIVDVGAGFGDFAILAATRFPDVEVLAFEPLPAAFDLLEENIARNAIENVDARRVAVGTRTSTTLVAGRHQALTSTTGAGEALVAPAQTLESLLDGRVVDLLKVDCEGAELDVLESGGALGRVGRIVVEYHRRLLRDADRCVTRVLVERGFEVRVRPDPYDPDLGYLFAARSG